MTSSDSDPVGALTIAKSVGKVVLTMAVSVSGSVAIGQRLDNRQNRQVEQALSVLATGGAVQLEFDTGRQQVRLEDILTMDKAALAQQVFASYTLRAPDGSVICTQPLDSGVRLGNALGDLVQHISATPSKEMTAESIRRLCGTIPAEVKEQLRLGDAGREQLLRYAAHVTVPSAVDVAVKQSARLGAESGVAKG